MSEKNTIYEELHSGLVDILEKQDAQGAYNCGCPGPRKVELTGSEELTVDDGCTIDISCNGFRTEIYMFAYKNGALVLLPPKEASGDLPVKLAAGLHLNEKTTANTLLVARNNLYAAYQSVLDFCAAYKHIEKSTPDNRRAFIIE